MKSSSSSPDSNLSAVAVGKVGELPPGTRKILEIHGKSIGIFNVRGEYGAVLNVCPHAFAPICEGRWKGTTKAAGRGEFIWHKEGEILHCPWHGWEFDLKIGACLTDHRKLKRFETECVDGVLYIKL